MTQQLKRVLVANRGEIAVRLIKSCKKLNITTIAIYTDEDASSPHVRLSDESYALARSGSQGYTDVEDIICICKEHKVQGVIPGYGFLSEDARFGQAVNEAGILFIGPSAETLVEFGLKHRARELAIKANVPVVPGTEMLKDFESAEAEARRLGFPIMVKATAGGGGMGLQVCHNIEELKSAVTAVKSRGETLFNNSGMFLEKYVQSGRHIETQIFGNGCGDILFFGERECSIQRRHQKVIEETPSPYILRHPTLRDQLRKASVALAAFVNYKSVGTVEFLVNNKTGEFYFLEMNTRLQVEHGITELCYNVDLVEMMLFQASEELNGNKGLSTGQMSSFTRLSPVGHAIEVRIYAENPAKGYAPAPGLFQNVSFPTGDNIRVDTWLETGTIVSPSFDPLLAKEMIFEKDRDLAIEGMKRALSATVLQGPPTNVELLSQIICSDDFMRGFTTTDMLATRFSYKPFAIEFIEPGTYTSIQDFPGRIDIANGVPSSGPMDDVSFRIGNILVGNSVGTEGFEITLSGPKILFYAPAVIAVCGGVFPVAVDGKTVPMWNRLLVNTNSVLEIGESTSGARAYLAIRGGLPSVAAYLGSKSTTPSLNWGGYQGRCLRSGDFLSLDASFTQDLTSVAPCRLPESLIPTFESVPEIYALPGPYYSAEFLSPEGQAHLFNVEYKVSFNSNRGGIRLEGPPPKWSRETGGEGGSHPSNIFGSGCPLGGVSFTGDAGVIFPVDAPNQSGFICTHTVIRPDFWRLGQRRPGEPIRFKALSWSQAMELEDRMNNFLSQVQRHVASPTEGISLESTTKLDWSLPSVIVGDGVLYKRAALGGRPRFIIRQAGERSILCEFGEQRFDINLRARVQQLADAIRTKPPKGLKKHSCPENCSVLFYYDPSLTAQSDVVEAFLSLEASLPSVESSKIPSRIIHLPLLFDAEECQQAVQRYMTLQRPYASYLPDNIDFIRRSNGLQAREDVMKVFVNTPHLVNAVGWLMGLPIYLQVDPRLRINVPKYNPSRTWTPAGAVGTGGITSSIYPNDSPGGYMLWGMTLPGCPWDTFGRKAGYTSEKPWLFEPFDQIVYHAVGREEYDTAAKLFKSGQYNIKIEDTYFDMAAYNQLVVNTAEEVSNLRKVQDQYSAIETQKERKLYQKWIEEKTEAEVSKIRKPQNIVGNSANIEVVSSMIGNIWKLQVAVGEVVGAGCVLAILESMKMEISIRAPMSSNEYKVELILKEPGDLVEAGDVLVLLSSIDKIMN